MIFVVMHSFAQPKLSVKSFTKLSNDLDARVNEPIKDQNGDKCAIIKVVTTQTGFSFDCGQIGIIKTVQKPSEIWVYVPYGAKRLTISHPVLGILRDYSLPLTVEKATAYELVLISGNVVTSVDETIVSQWLVITPIPSDAMVYINEKFVKNGVYQAKLKPGAYTYRVEAAKYHTEAGKIEITYIKKELTVQLKPAFGFANITSEPGNGAKIIVDGETLSQNTPFQNVQISSGIHTIQVIKENYQPSSQKVTIVDGTTSDIKFLLSPNFSEVNITTLPNAEIFIDNELKAKGAWQGRLGSGVYSLEARLDKYKSAKKDIEVESGEKQDIELTPTPIFGSLDVVSNPSGATIGIDGQIYGTTPNTIKDLSVGEHNIKLIKQGYSSVEKKVVIIEGKTVEFNDTLINIKPSTAKMSKSAPEIKPVQNFNSDYLKYKKSKNFWLVSTIVSGGAGVFAYLQAKDSYTQYQSATTDAESLYSQVQMYNTISPAALAIAGFCAVEFVIKSTKFSKAKSQSLGLYPLPVNQGAGLNLVYKF